MKKFALLLVALFLWGGSFISHVYGQEDSPLEDSVSLDDVYFGHEGLEEDSQNEITFHHAEREDPETERSTDTGDTTMESPFTASFYAGGDWSKTHTRGNETWATSQGLFAGGSIRTHVGDFNLGDPIRIELGVHVRGSFSEYESDRFIKYDGDGGEVSAGLEIYLRHAPDASYLSRGSMELRFLAGYSKIRGSLEDGSYKAVLEMGFVTLNGTLNLFWPFKMNRRVRASGSDYRIIKIRGVRAGVHEGFSPKIELRWDWKIPLHVSKRSTVTRAGGRDHAYERSFYGELRWHVWRHVNDMADTDREALWEFSYGPLVGLRWFQSNGRVSMDDGKSVYSYTFGAFANVTVNRTFGFEAYVMGTRETGKRQDVRVGLSLNYQFW